MHRPREKTRSTQRVLSQLNHVLINVNINDRNGLTGFGF
jgi:hypothetical protein